MPINHKIRFETSNDHSAVYDLQDAAFGGDGTIPKLVKDLRELEAALPVISLVAVDDQNKPTGHVMVTHAWIDSWDRMIDVMVLSPLGVRPDVQGTGIGSALIEASLAEAEKRSVPMVFLEGNDKYYGPRGFRCAVPYNIRRPSLRIPERAFQVHTLGSYQPDMTGTFVYHDVHWKHGVGLYRKA